MLQFCPLSRLNRPLPEPGDREEPIRQFQCRPARRNPTPGGLQYVQKPLLLSGNR